MSRIGSPKPRPPGSFAASSVKKRPLPAKTRILAVVSVKNEVLSASSPLNCTPERSGTWPFSARIQPFCETTTVIGSRSTMASAKSIAEVSGASAKVVRRWPSGVSGPNIFRTSRICPADRLPLDRVRAEQASRSRPSPRVRSPSSRFSSISSSLRSERRRVSRMALACSSVSLKTRISSCFGSSFSRMILMTRSRSR